MPVYIYSCEEHGEFEVFQRINDLHTAKCHCGKEAMRVFTPLALHGDLPSKDKRPGKTRGELFDNLAKEGLHRKDWREGDEDWNKKWRDSGYKEKPMVGWTSALDK